MSISSKKRLWVGSLSNGETFKMEQNSLIDFRRVGIVFVDGGPFGNVMIRCICDNEDEIFLPPNFSVYKTVCGVLV